MYNFAAILAKHGIASIAITGAGWGFGPLGTMDIKLSAGDTVTIPAGGRGADMDGNGVFSLNEGNTTLGSPFALITNRDGLQQTVADLMQLVRVIQVGMDVDGDGRKDIDAGRLYYFGLSLGGVYGIPFLAVENAIRAGAPQFAGSCANGVARGLKVEANPLLWRIVDGKLYVFAGSKIPDQMNSDPAPLIEKARANWKGLQN